MLIVRKTVIVNYRDGSRERCLEPGETIDEALLVPHAVQEHIRLGQLEPEDVEGQPPAKPEAKPQNHRRR